PLLPPRTVQASKYDIDSIIINGRQVEWISSKIVEAASQHQENNNQRKKSIKQGGAYKFTLLYRRSRDGKVANFRKLCNGKGPTITVGKVLDTDEILGGYNPLLWGSNNGYAATNESFIFALDKNINESIVSFASNITNAIYDDASYFPDFGGCDLSFGDGNNAMCAIDAYQVQLRH